MTVVAHLLQAVGHAVAGAGQVADLAAADRQVEADGLETRGRLEQLQRDVRVIDFHAFVVDSARRRFPRWR